MEYVYLVYLLRCTYSNSPCHGVTLNLCAQGIAFLLRQLLGIIEQVIMIVWGQYNRCGIHTAGKASAPSLVASCLYDASMVKGL